MSVVLPAFVYPSSKMTLSGTDSKERLKSTRYMSFIRFSMFLRAWLYAGSFSSSFILYLYIYFKGTMLIAHENRWGLIIKCMGYL
jgi:hypothetical protein